MAKSSGIFLNLSEDVIELIDERCGGPSYRPGEKRPGRSGGRAAWVRELIHRELGLAPPIDPHLEKSRQLERRLQERRNKRGRHVPALAWARTVERVLDLRERGKSLREIASALEDEGIETKRGGRWSRCASCRRPARCRCCTRSR